MKPLFTYIFFSLFVSCFGNDLQISLLKIDFSTPNPTNRRQAFELFNPTEREIDSKGYTVSVDDRAIFTVKDSKMIPSGGKILLFFDDKSANTIQLDALDTQSPIREYRINGDSRFSDKNLVEKIQNTVRKYQRYIIPKDMVVVLLNADNYRQVFHIVLSHIDLYSPENKIIDTIVVSSDLEMKDTDFPYALVNDKVGNKDSGGIVINSCNYLIRDGNHVTVSNFPELGKLEVKRIIFNTERNYIFVETNDDYTNREGMKNDELTVDLKLFVDPEHKKQLFAFSSWRPFFRIRDVAQQEAIRTFFDGQKIKEVYYILNITHPTLKRFTLEKLLSGKCEFEYYNPREGIVELSPEGMEP